MGVVDEFVRDERVQQGLDRRVRSRRLDQIGALQPHHFLVGKRFSCTKFQQRCKPHRWQTRGLDRAHIPARAFDAENVNSIAVEIGDARLHRSVAATVQNQTRILTQQTRGIDPERQIAAEVCIAGDRPIGVAIDPGALHQFCSFVIRPLPLFVRETRLIARRDRRSAHHVRLSNL
jgi:hypothetical protein